MVQRFEIDGPFWKLHSLQSWEERDSLKERRLLDFQNITYCREYVDMTDILLDAAWDCCWIANYERDPDRGVVG